MEKQNRRRAVIVLVAALCGVSLLASAAIYLFSPTGVRERRPDEPAAPPSVDAHPIPDPVPTGSRPARSRNRGEQAVSPRDHRRHRPAATRPSAAATRAVPSYHRPKVPERTPPPRPAEWPEPTHPASTPDPVETETVGPLADQWPPEEEVGNPGFPEVRLFWQEIVISETDDAERP
ncbi:MAG: hypothetical protein DIU60_000050 [Actinomycetes bacterium]|jgi:hypothetical protein